MSLKRICDFIIRRNVRFQCIVAERCFATESAKPKDEIVDITAADEKPMYPEIPDDPEFHKELAKKQNKSRLTEAHRNILMGVRPYEQPVEWYHKTVRYKRRMLGRYGLKSVDEPAGFAWPLLKEVKEYQDYERIAFPLSIQERWKKLEEEKRLKAEKIQAREAEITEKLAKMNQWTAELNAKIAKKEAELENARIRKEKIVEEVRKHFGFKISVHDEKFKTMMAQKEKEDKKKKKEAKKQAKLEKITKLAEKINDQSNEEQVTELKKPE
ncbi:hypothetical protein PUN28_016660 [Cardiocondyla obscurior]|uniref:Large ribosomal subunit protein mL64 n=1 Tax=Cardiocondyla obscurior TaxID=286306 RepID=A0AAW2ERY8_9HYME